MRIVFDNILFLDNLSATRLVPNIHMEFSFYINKVSPTDTNARGTPLAVADSAIGVGERGTTHALCQKFGTPERKLIYLLDL